MKKIVLFTLLTLLAFGAMAQHPKKKHHKKHSSKVEVSKKPVSKQTSQNALLTLWVDSMMNTLTLDEQIAQLMVVRVPLDMKEKQQREFEKLITEQKVGGVCFFAGTASKELSQTLRFQKITKIPLLICLDAEWGLGMRLTDCYSFPRQMMMGALRPSHDTLIHSMAKEIGKQCKNMGIQVNFAPVVDLNSNPLNPVIGARSFGENKYRVSKKGIAYFTGLQSEGVIATAKHFPGHGDTETDSHLDLPLIDHTKAYVDTVDLYPFRQLCKNGCRGVMAGHLQVSAYEPTPNKASSLSEKIINELLVGKMGFNGLVFTDGMDMHAVTKHYQNGQGELAALKAGNDILLLPPDVPAAIACIKQEAQSDSLLAQIIGIKCRKVLREKYKCGLFKKDFTNNLHTPNQEDQKICQQLEREITIKAATLVRNQGKLLPLQGESKVEFISSSSTFSIDNSVQQKIQGADVVVLELMANSAPTSKKSYGMSTETKRLFGQIAQKAKKSVLVIYGSPYILQDLDNDTMFDAIIVAYQNTPIARECIPQMIKDRTPFYGILPVSAGKYLEGNKLRPQPKPWRSPYLQLTKHKMDTLCFQRIDSIAVNGIKAKAYPGCQILVAHKGEIVYNRCYGHMTYDENSPLIDTSTVFDLASVTKVAATTFAVMKLYEAGKIQLDDKLSTYLPYLKHTDKKNITIKQALSHIARLKAYDAYWTQVKKNGGFDPLYIKDHAEEGFTPLCDGLWVSEEFRNVILKNIAASKLNKEKKYEYSDFGFILLADMVESVSGQSIDIFMQKHFYGPMGLKNTTFQPLQHGISKNKIAPTENDKIFRNVQLQGYVHDQNSALMGGVAGHAGLFSTANDLAKLYFMMLNNGEFKGKQYLKPETIATFNARYFVGDGNRRALGYDKPFIHGKSTHIAPEATQSSFGHTGFTGTMIWVDPDKELIYIFLSNRVYPEAATNKLAKMNIRTDIQSLIYKSLNK